MSETKREKLVKPIMDQIREGFVLASYRTPGESNEAPLRFKMVPRPDWFHDKPLPADIPISKAAGNAFITWPMTKHLTMWRVENRLGWADAKLPPGCDYWLMRQ